jgi:biotin carboxyl carrier protein
MKKLRITVNQRVYDVTVQVLEDDERIGGEGGLVLPPAPPSAAPPSAAPSSAAPSAHAAGRGDPATIAAPIAGVVQKIFVQAGSKVEAKTPLMMLDAMKMDTYIYATRTGEIEEVAVEVGASVQVGDRLVRYRQEA